MLTIERLKEVLMCDPETGLFTWLSKRGSRSAGALAGTPHSEGYVQIRIDGQQYLGHRLAWFYQTGSWPTPECDHFDLVKTNNRWGNLREATKSQNKANVRKPASNTSGSKGVSWHKKSGKWRAILEHNGKQKHIGLFSTIAEASAAYKAEATATFKEFARAA